ncbi:uncharacterized protein DNG_05722 [Cephalotrichum gorgonifer]|uniref:PPM-type phosphatase domain-containing protein n=1 Tax=Cephalotrichum gorgonifer TaxID=2041049 RepID=A0AAE8MYI2_9PEZI|nr:uncharacterized protein DNG_05722 [Cephalotrichum gorgonifer]
MLSTTEKGKQVTSPSPPAIPYTVFSNTQTWYLTSLLGYLTLASSLTATIYLPLIDLLTVQYNVSVQAINLTITLYVVFQGVAPSFFSPLSDTWGRRPVFLVTFSIYALSSVGLACISRNYAALLVLRAAQSIGGSAVLSLAYAVVADVVVPAERGKILAPMLAATNLGPCIGPVIGGGAILASGDPGWAFRTLVIFGGSALLLIGWTMPETARSVVGNGSVHARGIWRTWWCMLVLGAHGRKLDETVGSSGPIQGASGVGMNADKTGKGQLTVPNPFVSVRLIFYRDTGLILWLVASNYALWYCFQASIPLIFGTEYGFNDLFVGLSFLTGGCGVIAGGFVAGKLMDWNYKRTAEEEGLSVDSVAGDDIHQFPIEKARTRGSLAIISVSVLAVVGYGWAVQYRAHPALPLILQFFIGCKATVLLQIYSALLVDIFPETPVPTNHSPAHQSSSPPRILRQQDLYSNPRRLNPPPDFPPFPFRPKGQQGDHSHDLPVPSNKLAGNKRRSISSQGGGLLNRMFGGSTSSLGKNEIDTKPEGKSPSPEPNHSAANSSSLSSSATSPPAASSKGAEPIAGGEKRSGNGGLPTRQDTGGSSDKKRRSSSINSKASSLLASAKNSLSFSQGSSGKDSIAEEGTQTSRSAKSTKQDSAASAMGASHNNSAGESLPGPKSTFSVGVWEDKNRKCRRTMEDTHAFLYNFLAPPSSDASAKGADQGGEQGESGNSPAVETDNGYFAIFDGHAGTFAADWCGKKLHLVLEDAIRKNPNLPIPELLDQTFTSVDSQLEKLPLKNSGCTAAIAVMRWEDRSSHAAQGTPGLQPASLAAVATAPLKGADASSKPDAGASPEPPASVRIRSGTTRSRVLYTANVGDARIILCRSGKALRLSYDHKGSDENEGRRIANAGGLILNNRVNGVLAVTRALGDAYMKDLVTGHPYTTETVIQPETDEFIIIACDGLWDVCSDQEAVDLVREIEDPLAGAKLLVEHALSRFSTDNLSCMIVRLDKDGHLEAQGRDRTDTASADKPADADKGAAEGDGGFKPTALDSTVEEEPSAAEGNDEGGQQAVAGDSAPALESKEGDKAK